jgi:hypothetical protein
LAYLTARVAGEGRDAGLTEPGIEAMFQNTCRESADEEK